MLDQRQRSDKPPHAQAPLSTISASQGQRVNAAPGQKPVVIFYRDFLLPGSETFIRAQAEALERFTPYYAGICFVDGLTLPANRSLVVNRGGWLGRLNSLAFTRLGSTPAFARRLRQLRPALVHAQFAPDATRIMGLARTLGCPLIVHFRGYDVTMADAEIVGAGGLNRDYLRRREILKHQARRFIAVSAFLKRKAVERGFPEDKIIVHYTGINTRLFQPDPAIPRQPIVLFIGRLAEKKGCGYLLHAMREVQAVRPEAELVIIGDGPLRASLEAQAAQSLHRYRFLGHQPPEVVRQWLNRAALLCAPSVTGASGDTEGLPNVVLEAQAMATPVVATLHAGTPEAVIDGETGLLAPERDWSALAHAIRRLLDDADLRQRFSVAGQQRVRAQFDLHTQTRRLEDLYEQLVDEARHNA